jgi:hypothetical protein
MGGCRTKGGPWRDLQRRIAGPLERGPVRPSRGHPPPRRTDSTPGRTRSLESATTKRHPRGFMRQPHGQATLSSAGALDAPAVAYRAWRHSSPQPRGGRYQAIAAASSSTGEQRRAAPEDGFSCHLCCRATPGSSLLPAYAAAGVGSAEDVGRNALEVSDQVTLRRYRAGRTALCRALERDMASDLVALVGEGRAREPARRPLEAETLSLAVRALATGAGAADGTGGGASLR